MRDFLNAITQTVREVVGWVNLPLAAGEVVLLVLGAHDAPGEQIPHLRVRVCDILLHAQSCLARLVFSVAHGTELGEGLLDGSCTVAA